MFTSVFRVTFCIIFAKVMVAEYSDLNEQLETVPPDYGDKLTYIKKPNHRLKPTEPVKISTKEPPWNNISESVKMSTKDKRMDKSPVFILRVEDMGPEKEFTLSSGSKGVKMLEPMKHKKLNYDKAKIKKSRRIGAKKIKIRVKPPLSEYWQRPTTTPLIIQSYGYKVQAHEIITKDGYILTVYRIVVNFKLVVTDTSKAVLLHHGLSGNSADWLLGGSESLPFLLARQGYDVWLTNARGTIYSRAHMNHSVDSDVFWNFSFHEIGDDILPVLAYIKSLVGFPSRIYFIGHSMGATAFLAVMSTHLEYQNFVKMAVLLAPLAFMQRVSGPLKRLTEIDSTTLITLLGLKECPVGHMMYSLFIKEYCSTLRKVCDIPLLFLTNATATIHNTETLEMALMRGKSEMSMRTLAHILQLIQSGEFKSFDWGDREPWHYDLDLMRVPTAIFSSDSDIVAPTWDVVTLATQLSNILLLRTVESRDFGHMDFVWGLEAYRVLYPSIVALLEADI